MCNIGTKTFDRFNVEKMPVFPYFLWVKDVQNGKKSQKIEFST